MSEKLHLKHEQEHIPDKQLESHKQAVEKAAETKAEKSRHEHAENLESIRSKIESTAKAKHEHQKEEQSRDKKDADQPVFINAELKSMSYRRTMKRVQSQLPAPARAFSKVIHNPAVEAVSEVAGKTIARPSGILLGGIFAFLGSSLFLWVTRHYGYEYNYLLFALFFVGGYFIGLLVELGIKFANRRSSQ